MSKADWGKQYKADVQKFEKLHVKLLELTGKCIEVIETADPDSIFELLAVMTNNFNTHFLEEERVLKRLQFPEYKGHKQAHKVFLKKMLFFRRGSEEDRKDIAKEVARFLSEWQDHHILVNDKEYFSFVRVQLYLNAQHR